MEAQFTIFVVMPAELREPLLKALEACQSNVVVASNCREAEIALHSHTGFDVVFTSPDLHDGSWRTLHRQVQQSQGSAHVVVCLPASDGGVTDLLECGAAGVLTAPYDRDRVRSVLEVVALRRSLPPIREAGPADY